MNRYTEDYLFSQYDLSRLIEDRGRSLRVEVDSWGEERVLKTSPESLRDYLVEKYRIDIPVLGNVTVDNEETKIDVRDDFDRAGFDRSQQLLVPATEFHFYVEFSGDKNLFFCRPSTFSLNPPRAIVNDNHLIFTFTVENPVPENVRASFERNKNEVSSHLDRIKAQIAPFNDSLLELAKQSVDGRRSKVLNDKGILASLGYNLKQRENAPQTYTVSMPKKIVAQIPKMGSSPYVPDPIIDEKEYENVLRIITGMVHVIERSPNTFKKMGEEDLRQHFLVQLNGQYEGGASGETFNFTGKTDILIRVKDRNIFIAECKFWKGERALLKTIDQILGYLTWRDTKTAIILFNKNQEFTAVLNQIQKIVKKHPNYKEDLGKTEETRFNFLLTNKIDKEKTFKLSILVFNLPRTIKT